MPKKETQSGENSCAKCGSCTSVCPVYRASGGKEFYSARGRQFLKTIGQDNDVENKDIFANCLLCGACANVCSRNIDTLKHVQSIRANKKLFPGGYKKYLAGKILAQPKLVSQLGKMQQTLHTFAKKIPEDSGLRIKLAMLPPKGCTSDTNDLNSQNSNLKKLTYFPGCATSYLEPDTLKSTNKLFSALGYKLVIPDELKCCGLAHWSAGDVNLARKLTKQNIDILSRTEGEILLSCGSCYHQLSSWSEVFSDKKWQVKSKEISARCVEISQFIEQKIEQLSSTTNAKSKKIYYHDPCHFRNELAITLEPRKLLTKAGYSLLELPGGPQCCGMGGLFHLDAPKLSNNIRDDLITKVIKMQPSIITSTCSGCIMQWRAGLLAHQSSIEVKHLSELLTATFVDRTKD